MRVDFTQSPLLNTSNLYDWYEIGLSGVCFRNSTASTGEGALLQRDTISMDGTTICSTPRLPYWFDLLEVIGETKDSAAMDAAIGFVSNSLQKNVWCAVWGLLLSTVVLNVLMFFLLAEAHNAGSATIIQVSRRNTVVAFITFGAALSMATVATTYANRFCNAFNKAFSSMQGRASLGSTGIGLLWGVAVCSLVVLVLADLAWSSAILWQREKPPQYEGATADEDNYAHNGFHGP